VTAVGVFGEGVAAILRHSVRRQHISYRERAEPYGKIRVCRLSVVDDRPSVPVAVEAAVEEC
jgi:hypothetical protein